MSISRYESHQASGSELIGQVPTHWDTRALGTLGRFSASGIDKLNVEGQAETRMVNYTDVFGNALGEIRDGSSLMVTTAPPEKLREHTLADGDLLITPSSETAEDIGHAVVFRGSAGAAVFSYHLIRFQPGGDLLPDFAKWALNSSGVRLQLSQKARGTTRQILGRMDFTSTRIPLPPLAEQARIAIFLDRETAKIDALVEKQRRLIELLKEKRQAVISHAVTKGLDPSAPMKASGIEWLGEVPEHWEVLALGRVIERIEQGWSPPAYERPPEAKEASVLRLSAIKDGVFQAEQRKALPDLSVDELAGAPTLRRGDFLLTRANTPDLVGDCAIAGDVTDTVFSDLIYRIRFAAKALPEFMLLMLRSTPLRSQIRSDARGSSMSMAKLSHGHIKAWWATLPPPAEQRSIALKVSADLTKLTTLSQEANVAISLLLERRAALISAAVTGKFDVRDVGSKAEAA